MEFIFCLCVFFLPLRLSLDPALEEGIDRDFARAEDEDHERSYEEWIGGFSNEAERIEEELEIGDVGCMGSAQGGK